MIKDIKNNWFLDNFEVTGTSGADLLDYCKMVDAATHFEKLDFGVSEILTYLGIGNNKKMGKTLDYYKVITGAQCFAKHNNEDGHYRVQFGYGSKHDNYAYHKPTYFVEPALAQECAKGRFAIYNFSDMDGNGNSQAYIESKKVISQTSLYGKITGDNNIEKAMFIASKFAEDAFNSDEFVCEKYVLSRHIGDSMNAEGKNSINKVVSYRATEYKRIAYMDLMEAFEKSDTDILHWKADFGSVEVMILDKKEAERCKDLPYVPVYIGYLCDTQEKKPFLARGWALKLQGDSYTWFPTEKTSIDSSEDILPALDDLKIRRESDIIDVEKAMATPFEFKDLCTDKVSTEKMIAKLILCGAAFKNKRGNFDTESVNVDGTNEDFRLSVAEAFVNCKNGGIKKLAINNIMEMFKNY